MERQRRSGGRVLMGGYSTLLGLGLVAAAPWWLVRMMTTARYREGLPERLGRVPQRLRAAVAGRRVVWVHAVSVGEVLAVSRLVPELESALNKGPSENGRPWRVVVSTTTRTGQALARERFGTERVFYYPLDFAWAVRAYLRALRPAMVVLAESELWPRMLHECARREVPVAVVNARVSDRSFRRAMRVRAVWGHVLRGVSLFLAQSEADAGRLRALGARDGAVQVSGNLKYDVRATARNRIAEQVRTVLGGRPLAVAGSTLEGEEAALLRLWPEVLRAAPDAMLLLAPRHPERFDHVAALAGNAGMAVRRCSEGMPGKQIERGTVLLLDTLGDLAAVYALATVAFLGGSLVPRGGHNPLEPAQAGVPVLIGPSFQNFRDVVRALENAGGLRIVTDEAELAATLKHLFHNPAEAQAMGERGRAVFAREGGATARCIEALMPLIGHTRVTGIAATAAVREAVRA